MRTRTFFAAFFAAVLLPAAVRCQPTDYASIIQPTDTKAADFSEYLVQLAWLNNPASAIAQEEVDKSVYEQRQTKREWIADATATFNLNETHLRDFNNPNNQFFPRYNFGLGLNLGKIWNQKDKNRAAKSDVVIAQQRVNLEKLALRSETLSRYATFVNARQALRSRALVEQEAYSNYVVVQQLFKTDERTFEDYSKASATYIETQDARLKAQTDMQVALYRLEEIIGLKWEQVEHPGKE